MNEQPLRSFSWGVHHCATDPRCRDADPNAPNRLYINTPWGSLIIALDRDSTAQLWLPGRGYTWRWAPIVWHPKSRSGSEAL